jgi:hypothetical protein
MQASLASRICTAALAANFSVNAEPYLYYFISLKFLDISRNSDNLPTKEKGRYSTVVPLLMYGTVKTADKRTGNSRRGNMVGVNY